ncbi:pirin-like C-terminal cupin domain-containing protein [Myxococcus xanthus]|uniref:pirin-like C-terminal cupin domain-containing protein n=1 Tax=Myxococcus xanthus TaxID=34 RepID=UPI001F2D3BCE|nr:pirin-like C-terminal cupin domain-containing protein [Myxococcus xanthus]
MENGADVAALLLLQGRPSGEPVIHYGPFAMNSRQEIQQLRQLPVAEQQPRQPAQGRQLRAALQRPPRTAGLTGMRGIRRRIPPSTGLVTRPTGKKSHKPLIILDFSNAKPLLMCCLKTEQCDTVWRSRDGFFAPGVPAPVRPHPVVPPLHVAPGTRHSSRHGSQAH